MFARNGVWFLAVPVTFAVVALGISVDSLPPGEPTTISRFMGRSSALAPFPGSTRLLPTHADAAINLNVAATNAGPLVPITVSTSLPDARTFCVDVDLNHDDRFEGAGELGYATGKFDEAGTANLRLHGLIDGRYRARVRVECRDGKIVSAIQKFELLAPRNSHLPISFEVNKGQTDSSVLFLGRAKNQLVYVTREETVLVTTFRSQESGDRNQENAHGSQIATRFRLASSNSWAQPTGQKMLPGKANYFIGNDPDKWRTDIDTYQEVVTRDVYPGINMVYHSSQGQLEYDFRVMPGADPGDISLDFPDAKKLSIDDDGVLVVHPTEGEPLRHSAPVVYQGLAPWRNAVKGQWVLHGPRQAGFAIAGYDVSRELVIDPILFSTYLGGTGADSIQSRGMAADAGGCYITGYAASLNFPTTAGSFQQPVPTASGFNAIVAKLNPAGSAMLFCTYLGGTGPAMGPAASTNPQSIAVDGGGNVYVVGGTGSNAFPTTAGTLQPAFAGGPNDGYVVKLNPTGSALLYSTYLGSSGGPDSVTAVKVDAAGNAYIGGQTRSATFPTTPGAFQTAYGGGGQEAFVAKLNPAGSALVYSSFLGGNNAGMSETVWDLDVDAAGNLYATGNTDSANFPTTAGAFQTTFGGTRDIFILKVNPAGSTLLYSTLVGGTASQGVSGIAVDAAGNAFIAGFTDSNNYPTTPGVFQTTLNGTLDCVVTKLNPTGSALLYSTYLGGGANEGCRDIAIDAAGNAYVVGNTSDATFPTTASATQPAFGGGPWDGFHAQLDPAGASLVFSTFIGGSADDFATGVALDPSGAVYVSGWTNSNNVPTVAPLQPTTGGGSDIIIAKFTGAPPGPGVTIAESAGTTNVIEGGATDTYTVVLNVAPTADVIITIIPGTQVTVAPATLTFTTVNWNVAQIVTVTAVDDALVEGAHTGTITHTSASADAAYNAIAIASVTANITDNDGVPPPPPPPPPPGGGISEGNYPGSLGLANGNGKEGTFGFGRHMQQPRLKGPYRDPVGTFRVFNIAHQQRQPAVEGDSRLGVLGWGLMLLAMLTPAALVFGRRR